MYHKFKQFDYSNKVLRLDNLDNAISDTKQKLHELESERQIAKNDLPDDVYDLYEQQRTFDKLRGDPPPIPQE